MILLLICVSITSKYQIEQHHKRTYVHTYTIKIRHFEIDQEPYIIHVYLTVNLPREKKLKQNRSFYTCLFTKPESIKTARKIEKAHSSETVFRRPFASNKSHCVDKLSISTWTIIAFYVTLYYK